MRSSSAGADEDERLLTPVRISRGFWMRKHVVTSGAMENPDGANVMGPLEPAHFTGHSVTEWPTRASFTDNLHGWKPSPTGDLPCWNTHLGNSARRRLT